MSAKVLLLKWWGNKLLQQAGRVKQLLHVRGCGYVKVVKKSGRGRGSDRLQYGMGMVWSCFMALSRTGMRQ